MKRSIGFGLRLSVLMLVTVVSAGAQTLVPRENIPANVSPRVKELIELLYSSNEAIVGRAAANLGSLASEATPAIPFLVGILYDTSGLEIVPGHLAHLCSRDPRIPCGIRGEPTTVSRLATEALARMGEPALEPLLVAFTTGRPNRGYGKDPRVQAAAATALGLLKNPAAVPTLLRAFVDPQMNDVKGSIAEALGELGDAQAVEPLLAALKDEAVRASAAQALGNLRDRRAMEPLLELLGRSGIHSRRVIAEAIVKLGKPRPMDRLITLLNSTDSSIEESATIAVGGAGVADKDQSVIPLLAMKVSRPHPVGTEAVNFLRKLAREFWELDEIRDQAAVDALIAAVNTRDTEAAIVAAEILGDAKVQRAIPAIANAVIYGAIDASYFVGGYSNTGTEALKKINQHAAIEYMIGLAVEKKCGSTVDCGRISSALNKITGQLMGGADAAAWQRWWSRNKPRPAGRTTRRRGVNRT